MSKESIEYIYAGAMGERLVHRDELLTDDGTYGLNAAFLGLSGVCGRCGAKAFPRRHAATPHFYHEHQSPKAQHCPWYSAGSAEASRSEEKQLERLSTATDETKLLGLSLGSLTADWLIRGLRLLAWTEWFYAGKPGRKVKTEARCADEKVKASFEARFERLQCSAKRPRFAGLIGGLDWPVPGSLVRQFYDWKPRSQGLQARREQYLHGLLCSRSARAELLVFLQMACEIATRRREFLMRTHSLAKLDDEEIAAIKKLKRMQGEEGDGPSSAFLGTLAFGKNSCAPGADEFSLQELEPVLAAERSSHPEAYRARFAEIADVAGELLERFPVLELIRHLLADRLGEKRAKQASFIYLIENLDDPLSVKVGFSQEPEKVPGAINARVRLHHRMRVVETSLCYAWPEAERSVREELAREMGGKVADGSEGSAEWITWPSAEAMPHIEDLVRAFRRIAPKVAAEKAVALLGPIPKSLPKKQADAGVILSLQARRAAFGGKIRLERTRPPGPVVLTVPKARTQLAFAQGSARAEQPPRLAESTERLTTLQQRIQALAQSIKAGRAESS